ncbi:MAG: helix-turn-helix domain-containing protein [Christensenellaceae bacterium]|jgi:transcriptional regulator, cro/CI family|nr:helix-turn-helix transcriptional regulator [Bacillota bacterium]
MDIFRKNIYELRKLNRFTQREVAQRLGISQPSYIRYENGSAEPTLENLVKIADLYDVSVDFLLGRKEI